MFFAVRLTAFLVLLTATFITGYWFRHSSPATPVSASRRILYYGCPMHPQFKSDHPGDAACCGMRLEPVFAGPQSGTERASSVDRTLEISPAQQQLIGVQIGSAVRAPVSHVLRLPGRVTVDEARLYRIVAATDGWIRKLGGNSAGAFVRENEIIATYYTRDLLSAQQSLLYALNANNMLQKGQLSITSQAAAGSLNLQVAIDSLRNLGMSDRQIEEIEQTAVSTSEINIYSPITGFVIARGVSPGVRFEKGSELYRIADIHKMWVMADIFERDQEFVAPGARATIRYQGRSFPARISDSLPQFDAQTRTLKTRFEVDNPGHVFRPEMFVDVEVQITTPPVVTVPVEAVLDSGYRKTVYIARGNGIFEPRPVETGWSLGGRVEVKSGLEVGELVVASGNFLLDSESRMRRTVIEAPAVEAPSVARHGTVAKDPVCGMEVDPRTTDKARSRSTGKVYYFCSQVCKRSFESSPAKYDRSRPAGLVAEGREPM